ncbi:MAG: ATP-binding cassette domain-containing protein [Cyanobacteriota bacterium]|nr:ATP-binding cassette domain-containing protein [Cyanobacteriota bacterium]
MDPPLLEVWDLAFAYGQRSVLHAIDLALSPASCLLIRGVNGAGKSTLLRLLQGALQPSQGWVRLNGRPLRGQRRRIALVPQTSSLNWSYPISVGGLLELAGGRPSPQARHQLQRVGLADREGWPIGSLSVGQRQRLQIALALAQEPQVLLLDEPLASLDPSSRLHLGSWLRALVDQGLTVVLSVHGELPPTLPRHRSVVLEAGTLHPQPSDPFA